MTKTATITTIKALGLAASCKDGEYRITTGGEEAAYYTDDADDAIATAKRMVAEKPADKFVVIVELEDGTSNAVEIEGPGDGGMAVHDNLEGAELARAWFIGEHFNEDEDSENEVMVYRLVEVETVSKFKSCYLCGEFTTTVAATEAANIFDRMVDAPIDEWPNEEARETFMAWVDENLTSCRGPKSNFLDDGRVVLCDDCMKSAGDNALGAKKQA